MQGGQRMKKLVLTAWVFLSAAILFAAALTVILIFHPAITAPFAFLFFAGGMTAVILLINTRKNLSAAHAIVDSAVIHIQPAVIQAQSVEEKKEAGQLQRNFGIYVSSFGILLGAKVIRFNQSGIWLRNVEIGEDYIFFIYGVNGEELHNIRLLYSKPSEDELAVIIENFRKDTGVVPVVA